MTPISHLLIRISFAAVIALPTMGALAARADPIVPVAVILRTPSDKPASVDPATAAAVISAYRKSKGLPAVTISAKLNAIAERQARAMAKAGRMSHKLFGVGNFPRRLTAGGYDAAVAAENLAAGPSSLDEAMAGWRSSSGHNANLLKPGVTEIGVAVSYSSKSKYRDFWALVLAAPDERPKGGGGPTAGPPVMLPFPR